MNAPTSNASSHRRALVVWGTWALTLVSLLVFIVRDGRNIPFEEDWLMVAPMTGNQPDLPDWLWSQNSEHRLPLPRLLNLTLLRLSGDFRSTMIFDALLLGGVAAGMILVARRLRGRTSLADVFFPLLLLQLGNWDNLVWAWQIQFVLPTALACVLLVVIVASPTLSGTGTAVAGALALVCLPLSGANGLVLAPPLAAWFACQAAARRSEDRSWRTWLPALGAVAAVLLCGIYFIGYESSPWNAASPGPGATLATFAKFLALGLGPVAKESWLLFGGAAALIFGSGAVVLLAALRDRERRADRLRLIGLLAFLAAALLLAFLVGWGRAGRAVETGRMPPRYVLLAAPGMCAAYFALLLHGRWGLDRLGPPALALLVALLFPLNTHVGLERRAWFGAGFAAFEQDLAAGASARELARRHHEFLLHWDEGLMVVGLRQLHEAGVGPFADWEPGP